MAGIDINRTTAGVNLPPQLSSEIWGSTVKQSAVMQLARRVTLPGGGLTIPVITGDPVADWVDETDEKPVSRSTFGEKSMTGYTLAVIEPFSNQFRRDLPGLYAELARRLPFALGKKFDQTVFGGTAPGSNFDTLAGVPTATIDATDTFGDLIAVNSAIAAAGGRNTGWALSPQGEAVALGSVDANGRPLFISDLQREGSVGALLGRPVYLTDGVYAADADGDGAGTAPRIGYAGDWSNAMYGVVEGIKVDFSDQATLNDGGTQLNLWQRNMFALRAEVEIGFIVRDKQQYVELLGA